MPVHAIIPDYKGEVLDKQENFGGNQLVYVGWDHHLMFCAAFAYPVAPDISFNTLLTEVIPSTFDLHEEFTKINWDTAEWMLNGQPFIPQLEVSLKDQGIEHKSLLRFHTPELKGFQNAGV
ncbi:MAG: phenol hydroxylase subunit P4 [Motiliproteus sp.]